MEAYLTVQVTPRARQRRVAVEGNLVRIWVTPPPDNGRANAEALDALAEAIGVRRSALRIVAGATGRRKVIAVEEMSPEGALSRFSRQ